MIYAVRCDGWCGEYLPVPTAQPVTHSARAALLPLAISADDSDDDDQTPTTTCSPTGAHSSAATATRTDAHDHAGRGEGHARAHTRPSTLAPVPLLSPRLSVT